MENIEKCEERQNTRTLCHHHPGIIALKIVMYFLSVLFFFLYRQPFCDVFSHFIAALNTHSNQIIFIKLFVGVKKAQDDGFHPISLRYGSGQVPKV